MHNNITKPKQKVIFDCDDILWGLNEEISKQTRIDFQKLVTYNCTQNPLLTPADIKRLQKAYADPSMFERTKFYPGVERIKTLNADVYINSHSFTQEMLEIKKHRLLTELNFPEDHMILTLIQTPEDAKELPKDTYIFVDDACKNLVNSPAHYNLMIQKPWNKDMSTIRYKYVEKFDTLKKVIDRIEFLITH